jgi:hypothetical protein
VYARAYDKEKGRPATKEELGKGHILGGSCGRHGVGKQGEMGGGGRETEGEGKNKREDKEGWTGGLPSNLCGPPIDKDHTLSVFWVVGL